MVIIPNFDRAVIARQKLSDYLLNPAHKVGAPKLRFLESFGFSRDGPDEVSAALLAHGGANPATVKTTPFGLRYEVDGPLQTPSSAAPLVRTVWQEHEGGASLRFVTMVPRVSR
jgi:hypothetical protein